MNTIESIINIGIMRNQGGAEYLYDLANSNLTEEQKVNTIRDLVSQAYEVCTDEFFDWEQEYITDARGIQTHDVIDSNFLWYVFESILSSLDWHSNLKYHKNRSEVDKFLKA